MLWAQAELMRMLNLFYNMDTGSVAKSNFPGYLSSEAPSLLSNHTFAPTDLRSYSSDFLLRDKSLGSVPYGVDDSVGSRVRSDSGVGVTAGSSLYDPLEDTEARDRILRSMTPGVYGVDAVSISVRGEPGLTVTAGAGLPDLLPLNYPLSTLAAVSKRLKVRMLSHDSIRLCYRDSCFGSNWWSFKTLLVFAVTVLCYFAILSI